MEKTPDDMHRRLAKEFARMEDKFITRKSNHLTEGDLFFP
jgi:hypothetical protein